MNGTNGMPNTPTPAADTRRRILLLAGAALGAALIVLVLLVSVFGARLEAPTVALSAASAALVYALGQLYAMVRALSQPDRVAQVGQAAGSFTQAELRDEKRRLLRAIKELEFDFGMGKLSQVDHDTVIATYRLRAIEVMRALEGGSSLHPELARLLAEREAARVAASEPAAPVATPVATPVTATTTAEKLVARLEVTPMPEPGPAASGPFDQTTRICGSCGGTNDADARYCKLCGAAMKKAEAAARAVQAARSGEIGGAS
jgi:hypothetical protein